MSRRFAALGTALILTLVAVLLMTLPGNSGIVLASSRALGGTELTDAIGHVALFAVLTLVWYRAARTFVNDRVALSVVVIGVVILGITTELSQRLVPERGSNIVDLVANGLGVSVAWALLRFRRG